MHFPVYMIDEGDYLTNIFANDFMKIMGITVYKMTNYSIDLVRGYKKNIPRNQIHKKSNTSQYQQMV